MIHTAMPQPAAVIPPKSSYRDWCVPEGHLQFVGRQPSLLGPPAYPFVADPEGEGRIIFTFEKAGGKKITWEGKVSFSK